MPTLRCQKLSKSYWTDACRTAIYLKNRSHRSIVDKTPEEVWTRVRPDLSHLKVFGCRAYYAHVPKQERKKLDAKSKEWIFIGYSLNPTAYRLRDCSHPKKLIKSRDVVFLEDSFFDADSTDKLMKSDILLDQLFTNNSPKEDRKQEERIQEELDSDNSYHSVSSRESQEELSQDDNLKVKKKRRYPERQQKKKEFQGYMLYETTCIVNEEPQSIKETMESIDKDKWKSAMEQELQSLKDNNT